MHQALTSGSGIWENAEDKHWDSSTAPQPRSRRWGGHTGWSPTILSPSFSPQPPCPLSPSSSASSSLPLSACPPVLAPCTGQDHNGPGWLMVTMVLTAPPSPPRRRPPYTVVCSSLSRVPFYQNTAGSRGRAGGLHCSLLKTAPLQWREPTLQLEPIN